MIESDPPRRSDITTLESRLSELERMVRDHREESERRHAQRERDVMTQNRLLDGQRTTLETIVDRIGAVILDQETLHRQQTQRELVWQEEKGALLGQMARDARSMNARFDLLDQNDISQNSKIAGLDSKITGLDAGFSKFREAADTFLSEMQARKEAEKRRDKLLARIELYCKVFVAVGAAVILVKGFLH